MEEKRPRIHIELKVIVDIPAPDFKGSSSRLACPGLHRSRNRQALGNLPEPVLRTKDTCLSVRAFPLYAVSVPRVGIYMPLMNG